ncbi:MAG TPA: FG-GAP-like repeat-containing protein [Vicinamibacterales bacterium]|nr:FG-GAP-like repeat-containing protein [Vicinamibacterales bacterium]
MPGPAVARWVIVSLAALALAAGCRRPPAAVEITPALVEANNRGVGLMGQFDFDGAVAVFETLAADHPQWAEGQFNLAVALMNRQGEGDAARAARLLETVRDSPSIARRARYALGLLLLHEGREQEALPHLEEIATTDPPDGFAAYFAGQLRLGSSPAEALEWYERARRLEPMLRSAHYGAFLALQRLGRRDEAKVRLDEFQALARNPQAMLAEFKYTRMGPLSEAVTVDVPDSSTAPDPAGARFVDAVPLLPSGAPVWRASGTLPPSITAADIDGDGAIDLFITGIVDGTAPNAVLLNRSGSFVIDRAHPLAALSGVSAALWGDLDDDGLVDVVLCRRAGGTQIWRQAAAGEWRNVTSSIGLALSHLDVVDGALVDADHDGDLDIWLVNASGPNELLNNDGNGRFRAIASSAGVAGDGRPSRGIVVADLDGDRDVDVIVLKAEPPHDVFLNQRVWEYQRDGGAALLAAAPIASLVAGDLDADGQTDLYAAGPRGVERWRRDQAGRWQPERVATQPAVAEIQLAFADTNGDGAFELVVTSPDGWVALDAAVPGGAPVFSAQQAGLVGWTVAELDVENGPSLVGVRADGTPVIWRPGPGRHNYVGLQFTGRDPRSDQRRSNVSGIGARVAVRTGSNWTAFESIRLNSGPGQSLQPVTVGLGGAARADFVAMTWSDGVFQTELGLEGGRLHLIAETQRQLSSCPVLFAWDGTRFAFVTDLLGVGGIGFMERPGRYAEPFPREDLLLPEGALAPRDGRYQLKIGEPMEEVAYLDAASLVAYDLPPGWQMVLDERKSVTGAAPTGRPLFYREERLPARAVNHLGDDVIQAVRELDLIAAGPEAVHPRFVGLAREHVVEIEFSQPIARGPGRPVLMADGWVEYPYAQTVFAAWQAGAAYQAPTLEARDRAGRWHEVARQFGYPAGMPKRMVLPLPDLPVGTTALRLRTTQEIYWDRLAIVYAEEAPLYRRHVLPLTAARLQDVGFARRTTGPQRVPRYDYDARAPLDDTRHPRGWYTEFGRVDELVAEKDDAVAIFGPGEEVHLEFAAPPEGAPEGWTRRLVLEARGWCKDMDLYTKDGETVEPLPGRATPAREALHRRYNTRYQAGL